MVESGLERPVHLYVKTHRVTRLKYFGRTTADPYSYRGSGAYWISHLEKFGAYLSTEVIGTFDDPEVLRRVARDFSNENDIARSPEWANLWPEDGDVDGHGWAPGVDYSRQIDAIDAYVATQVRAAERVTLAKSSPRPVASTHETKPWGWVAAIAIVIGVIWVSNGSLEQSPPVPSAAAVPACGDLLDYAVKQTRADSWREPGASEFMDGFARNCASSYSIWVDYQSIRGSSRQFGITPCSDLLDYRVEREAIELARQHGYCGEG